MFAKTTFAALIGLASLASAVCAHAASPGALDTVSVTVSVADLNLQTEGGARVALRRIEKAAQSICGEAPSLTNLDRSALHSSCMASTTGEAVARLNSAVVAALHQGRSGPAPIVTAQR